MIINTINGRAWNCIFLFLIVFILTAIVNTFAVAADHSEQAENNKQDVIYACPMHPEVSSHSPGKCSICGMFLVAQDTHGSDSAHANHNHAAEGEDEDAENVIYACPMHPDETSHAPGKCSLCGMFLVAGHMDNGGTHEHQASHDTSPVQENGKPALFWENSESQVLINQQHRHRSAQDYGPVSKRLMPETDNSAGIHDDVHVMQSPVSRKESLVEGGKGTAYICPMHPQIVQHEPGGSCPICGMDLVAREKISSAEKYPQVFLEAAVVQNMGVRTSTVQRKVMKKRIQTQGLVTADEDRQLSIHARAGGWIEKLHLLTEGDRIERKEILLDFYSPWINQAQLKYIRALEEYDQLAFDPAKKTEVSALLDSTRNSLRLLNVMDMDIMRIRNTRKVQNTIQMLSPQGGIITDLNVSEGMYVEPFTPMFTIVDLKQVWVMVDIYEHQAPWVRKGNTVEITAPAIPARVWQGEVDYIYPDVDPKTRTLRARIVVPNPDEALLLNMFVKVDITADSTDHAVLTVPREAVILTGEREAVIKYLGQGHFQPVDVKTGMRGEGSVEVLSGLQQGDEIVVSGQFLIDSESSLQASFLRMSE